MDRYEDRRYVNSGGIEYRSSGRSRPQPGYDRNTKVSDDRGSGSVASHRPSEPCRARNCEYKVRLVEMRRELSGLKRQLEATEIQLRERDHELLIKLSEEPDGAKAVLKMVAEQDRRAAEGQKRRDKMEAQEKRQEAVVRKRHLALEAKQKKEEVALEKERLKTQEERLLEVRAKVDRKRAVNNPFSTGSRDSARGRQHPTRRPLPRIAAGPAYRDDR